MHFEDWTSRRLDKWGIFDMWIRVFGCPDTLCRDYLGLFAVGSLVGKTKEVDMKFTREHGIARMRIDCANPQLIPRYLDHFWDGEGFGIEIHVEALDGSVVPAGFADQDEDNDDSDSKKDSDGTHEANNNDKGKPPSAVAPADKAAEEQQNEQTGSEEMVEAVDQVQVGIDHFACPSTSPLNRGSKSVPSKRWYQIVEEDETEVTGSAPHGVVCEPIVARQDNHVATGVVDKLVFSLPGQTVDVEDSMASIHRQSVNLSQNNVQTEVGTGENLISSPRAEDPVLSLPRQAVHDSQEGVISSQVSFPTDVVEAGDEQRSQLPLEKVHLGDFSSPSMQFPENFSSPFMQFTKHFVPADSYVFSQTAASPHTPQGRGGSSSGSLHPSPMKTPSAEVITRGTGVFLGGRYSKKDVIAFGGISEEAVFGVRTSERIKAQPNADVTQLERAQQNAQARDDILYSGTNISSKFTIASIPNEVVVARASKLGISLGVSPSNVSTSINKIKDIDLQRTLIMLRNKSEVQSKEDDTFSSLVMDEANGLSSDLVDEEHPSLEGHKDPPLRPTKPIRVYKRRIPDVAVVRRCSARLKNKNKNSVLLQ
jgi:hypothetical protein